jgi:acyl carrier protein
MANDTEILDGLADIVRQTTGDQSQVVNLEQKFEDDLEIDSLSMVDISVQVEERFGVSIPDDDLPNLKTVQDAVNYVAATKAAS